MCRPRSAPAASARESGSGIVAYSVDDAGRTVLFTINGELFVCELGEDGVTAETRRLELTFDDDGERQYATPILNPRVSPDGTRVAYATGTAVVVAETATGRAHAVFTVAEQDRATMRAGLAEFAAAEEMDRYSGFWWGPIRAHCSWNASTPPPNRCGRSATRRTQPTRACATATRAR